MISLLLAVSLISEIDRSKPVVYFINQNPTAVYYGNPASRYFADNGYSVVATYINMDANRSQAYTPNSLRLVVEDIKRVKPEIVFVMGTGFSKELRSIFDNVVIFNLVPGEYDILVENPIKKLVNIVNRLDINKRFYLLRDQSSKSFRFSALYKDLLVAEGIPEADVIIVDNKDTVGLEKNLRALNKEDRSVIINCMYVLRDLESVKDRYIDDIKHIITRVNRKHLDVGSYIGYGSSTESLVLQIDYRKMSLGRDKAVPITAYFNIKRLDKLGLREAYLRSFELVDGVVYE